MHKYNHKVTWKEFGKRIEKRDVIGWCSRWSEGDGKYYKQKLSKARRRLEKEIIAYQLGETDRIRMRGFTTWNTICNWKNW